MPNFSLSNLNETTGFRINGIDAGDQSGYSIAYAGDVNGDGIDDVIIGAPGYPNGVQSAGESYVVFGSAGWSTASIDLAALDGSNGFRIDGIDVDDYSGFSVASAGDVNGDGIGDVIIGAPFADPDGNSMAGESYVVFGSAGWSAGSIDLAALDGSNGFRIDGVASFWPTDLSGDSVSSAGDVNGDGIGDVIIGAGGESYVVFGSAGWSAASIDLATLDGTNGFQINSGRLVASAGDVNGDGIDDVLIGYPFGDPNRNPAGESYVVFGSAGWSTASIDLAALDGSNGFRIDGIDASDSSGVSVSSAGDVNGDGIDDVIIGAYLADPNGNLNAGESYVVFGSAGWTVAAVDLAALDGSNGFRIDGLDANDVSGASVSTAGDVNGDGVDDVIIGAPLADPSGRGSAGETYVVYGVTNWSSASIDLAALDGSNGFRIDGLDANDRSGASVSTAGDVNGDGFADLLVGASWANDRAGESYILFGSAAPGLNVPTGSVIVSGDAIEDAILTADASTVADADGLGTFNYQWQRDGVNIVGANDATYTLTQADVGSEIRAVVSYTDLWGNDESVVSAATATIGNVNDAPTGAVTISGLAEEGRTLSANVSTLSDEDGLGLLNYQWQREGVGITGATASSYVLTQVDVGSQMTVVVSYDDGQGTQESVTSDATGTVSNVNGAPTGAVTISGTVAEDQVLTATNTLADEDGIGTLSYQWQRGGQDITGATSDTYTLTQADVGAGIRVVVSYTDGYGAEESVTSDPTDAVVNVNDTPTGSVAISGTAIQGATLTADASGLDDPDGLASFSYQWIRDGSPISGANTETYALTQDDVDAAISVTVSYTDGYGADEVVSSAATDPVASTMSSVNTTLLDRFGQVVTDGAVAVREMDGGSEVFVREVNDDTASGTVFEIVVQPSTDISALDFELYDNAGLVDFQVSQALSDWIAQTNTSVTDQVIFSGFGALDGSLALPAGQETVVGLFETAPDVDFDLAGIFLNGTSAEAISVQDVALDAQQNNVFTHSVANGADAQVAADRALDVVSENAIGAFDALQALRLAVGLAKSDGTAEWHDYFAADINQDGRVGADDALNILKFAVGLTDGPAADWVFVDGDADYSDVTRQNSGYSEGMLQTDVTADTSVNLVGILVGDVDGSYALTAI